MEPGAAYCAGCGARLGLSARSPARVRRALLVAIPLALIVLAGAGAALWRLRGPTSPTPPSNSGRVAATAPGAQQAGAEAEPGAASRPAPTRPTRAAATSAGGAVATADPDARFLVAVEGKFGYIDRPGHVVIEPTYETALEFAEGLAPVAVGDRLRLHRPCREARDRRRLRRDHGLLLRGFAPVVGASRGCRYADSGVMVITQAFEHAGRFHEGLAPVMNDNQWGYIDVSGDVAIGMQYEYAGEFGDGLAPVSLGGKMGYINRSGQMVISPRFSTAMPFSDGLAAVAPYERFGYIDTDGTVVIEPQFQAGNLSPLGSRRCRRLRAGGTSTVLARS